MTDNDIGKVVVDAAIAVHKPLGSQRLGEMEKNDFTQSRKDR